MKKPSAGAARMVGLDNLQEGVLAPDIDDSTLNPVVLRHYGAVARPCRVWLLQIERKVEPSVGHAQKTPLKGLRFERLEEARAYLDH